MYNTIKRLYLKTKNTTILTNALAKGWLTEEQYNELTAMLA